MEKRCRDSIIGEKKCETILTSLASLSLVIEGVDEREMGKKNVMTTSSDFKNMQIKVDGKIEKKIRSDKIEVNMVSGFICEICQVYLKIDGDN